MNMRNEKMNMNKERQNVESDHKIYIYISKKDIFWKENMIDESVCVI